MGWLNAIYVVGVIASVIGVVLFFVRRSDRYKLLTYAVTIPLALARVLPQGKDHRLSILYERSGVEPENVKAAYVQYLRLANLGREPIKRDDIAPADPLRLEITGRVLDVSLDATTRNVINFALAPFVATAKDISTAECSFDFLDYQDGALIRVLTENSAARCRLVGTVVGMPQGIRPLAEISRNKLRSWTGGILSSLAYAIGLTVGVLIFYRVTGDWAKLWLFLIPLLVVVVPGLAIAGVATTIWPKGRSWPAALTRHGPWDTSGFRLAARETVEVTPWLTWNADDGPTEHPADSA